jgi:hypothetical protein
MRELLNAPVAARKGKSITFHVEASPRIALVGRPVTVTCYVPVSMGRPAAVRLDFDGEKSIDPDFDGVTKTMTKIPACGVQEVFCAVASHLGVKTTTVSVEVRGGMCDGTQDAQSRGQQ